MLSPTHARIARSLRAPKSPHVSARSGIDAGNRLGILRQFCRIEVTAPHPVLSDSSTTTTLIANGPVTARSTHKWYRLTESRTVFRDDDMYSRLLPVLILLSSVITFTGCAEDRHAELSPPVMQADSPAQDTNSAPQEPVTSRSERRGIDGLEFRIPDSWKEVPLSKFQMGIIAAKFSMPDDGPDVTLTLSRSGGSLEDNLDRWRGQVNQSRAEVKDTIRMAGYDATRIDLEGRFSPGFGRDPQDGWRMLGVIVPLPGNGYFMKLTGPVDQVEAVEKDFGSFVKSAHLE